MRPALESHSASSATTNVSLCGGWPTDCVPQYTLKGYVSGEEGGELARCARNCLWIRAVGDQPILGGGQRRAVVAARVFARVSGVKSRAVVSWIWAGFPRSASAPGWPAARPCCSCWTVPARRRRASC